MSSSQTSVDGATEPTDLPAVPMRFEVTTVPVADVDRAKDFYQRLGWRLDTDFKPSPDTRGVQFTPPGSPASIQFGQGTTTMTPGSLQGMIDPQRRSYFSRATFADPDGNTWQLQEITERLPGRV